MSWDKANSTFWWRISLNPDHAEYTSSSKTVLIHGYSKRLDHAERIDKYELLQKNCVFLVKQYLKKSLWISIHKRLGSYANIQSGGDPAILLLYPDQRPILTKHMAFESIALNNDFQRFISRIYEENSRGGDIDKYRPGQSRLTKDDYLDIHKHSFRSLEQLNNYLVRLHTMKFSPGEIEHFYNSYTKTYTHLS